MAGPFSSIGGGGGLTEAQVEAEIAAALTVAINGPIQDNIDASIVTATAGPIQTNINNSINNAIAGEIQDNIDAAIAAVIGTATALGDTLGELETRIDAKVAKAGDNMTGTLNIAATTPLETHSDSFNIHDNFSHVTGSGGVIYRNNRSRGTQASPTVVADNDTLVELQCRAYHGSGYTGSVASFNFQVIEDTPSSTAMQTRWRLLVTPLGSVTIQAMLAVDTSSGLMMGASSDIVIDANRHHRARSYTVGTLPSASPAGQRAKVSDAAASPVFNATPTGGGSLHVPVMSDGTNWRYG